MVIIFVCTSYTSIIYNKQIPEIKWISFVTQEYHDHNQWMTHLIAMAKSTCFFLWLFSDPGSIYFQMARKLLAEECRLSWLLIIKCERTIYIQKKNKYFYSCPQARMCIIHAVLCVVLPRKFGGSVIRPLLARMAVALRADCMCVSCSEAHDLEHASYMSSSVIAR